MSDERESLCESRCTGLISCPAEDHRFECEARKAAEPNLTMSSGLPPSRGSSLREARPSGLRTALVSGWWLFIGVTSFVRVALHSPFSVPGGSLPYWYSAPLAAAGFFFLGARVFEFAFWTREDERG